MRASQMRVPSAAIERSRAPSGLHATGYVPSQGLRPRGPVGKMKSFSGSCEIDAYVFLISFFRTSRRRSRFQTAIAYPLSFLLGDRAGRSAGRGRLTLPTPPSRVVRTDHTPTTRGQRRRSCLCTAVPRIQRRLRVHRRGDRLLDAEVDFPAQTKRRSTPSAIGVLRACHQGEVC